MASLKEWLERTGNVRWCTSTEYWYDDMESQSDKWLPFLYREFDLGSRGDWHEEGQILDFICATECQGKRVLDFGPGDGWPSLRIAGECDTVVGVDASRRRVEECSKNGSRLGVSNAAFVEAEAAEPLPFDSDSFDAVTAADSIEQTPSPLQTLKELYRVLKPGGRLRMIYEDLDRYRGKEENEGWIEPIGEERTIAEIMEREPDGQFATMARLTVRMDHQEAREILGVREDDAFDPATLTSKTRALIAERIEEGRACRLFHPSGKTFVRLLSEAGFSAVEATHDGGAMAARIFSDENERAAIGSYDDLHCYLRPIVAAVVTLPAPIETNPKLTAIK